MQGTFNTIMKIYNPFKKNFSKQELDAFEFLANVSYFSKFTIEEFEDIFPYLHLRTYKQNEVVFFRNDPSQAVYIIKKGKIEINLDIKDIFEVVETVKSGDIIFRQANTAIFSLKLSRVGVMEYFAFIY